VLEVERLGPIPPTMPPNPGAGLPCPAVTFYETEMNALPYLVARVGSIVGSPAPVFLTCGHERESALAWLVDVFRIGVRGQAFRDFLEAGRKQGKSEAEIVEEWKGCKSAVVQQMRGGLPCS
jgi:hypothetical protein